MYDKYKNSMYNLMCELFPVCRSLTGNGVRKTLEILKKNLDLQILSFVSGEKVFDWTIPKEWNIVDAYIKNEKDEKIVDFNESNLHVLNYSLPINEKISLKRLKNHLFSLPDQPNTIPYRTSYYNENWGFCIQHNKLLNMKDEFYDVFIDSSLENGELNYGEYYKEGVIKDEVLLSTYICHPSLCNDNLSGIVLIHALAIILSSMKTKFSYRFLFIPETIGAIAWLHRNAHKTNRIKHGLVATCVGDKGIMHYKKSRDQNAEINTIVENVLMNSKQKYKILNFWPQGSDERQFCSPGFNLPIGSLMRTPYGNFKEYHTSEDNLNFICKESLYESLLNYLDVIQIIENNGIYKNLLPFCEPQLGKRGLYRQTGAVAKHSDYQKAMMWILNFSDGKHSLLKISNMSKIKFDLILEVNNKLLNAKIIEKI